MDADEQTEVMLRERTLVEWYESAHGREVGQLLRAELAELLAERFGYLGVQLGGGGIEPSLIEASRVRQREVISSLPQRGTIQASAQALPLASECADLLLLAHVVERTSDPYPLFRELERVLVPEGDAVVVSFNPWGIWGVWSWLADAVRRGDHEPWRGRFYSARRVKDWLRLLGFEIIEVRRLVYRPPSWRGWLGRKLHWLERAGPRWFPVLGGMQIIVARKRRTRMTLIRPRWRRLPAIAGGVVKPTSRSMFRVDDRS
jgi:SAM-dependent methyltransferase